MEHLDQIKRSSISPGETLSRLANVISELKEHEGLEALITGAFGNTFSKGPFAEFARKIAEVQKEREEAGLLPLTGTDLFGAPTIKLPVDFSSFLSMRMKPTEELEPDYQYLRQLLGH